ncbi:carboxylesterase/lipase family protein [Tunturibacter empetritectus]|uniref:Carboxylic ester hydrolase n=1 Tax=Tunturiibacter lichenicola TaxID=2051959 RepID=A0A7W8J480_9BACT|nr:carboxylesterase/lipase family protein [Edaphobacter lichenicola]MBB5342308.1 para-nitrobenzyl esterase [Edaphobacter lichenicola]
MKISSKEEVCPPEITTGIARRSVLKSLALAAGAVGMGVPAAHAAGNSKSKSSPLAKDPIFADATKPIVETDLGKVRGYIRNGIFTFKGIPYGDDTGGSARFMPPKKAKPWTNLRSSMHYGSCCPQPDGHGWKHDEEAWMFAWDDGTPGEDCLCLNVWTPGINDNKKRPVMVWLHGGGYTAGSAQELKSYDGENLARRGDIVMVSINHRLNVFGHLDLSAYGPQYAESGNVGMLDIVLALEWVRDNIANFGGDPGCVTVFGQSGGGGKVCTLTCMPSAEGLFHRAIVQSGSLGHSRTPENAAGTTDAFLKQLNLDRSSIAKLNDIPWREIEAAAVIATRPTAPPTLINFRHMGNLLGWAPVLDGKVVTENAFDPKTPDRAKKIPLLVGTNLNEFVTAMDHPEYWQWTDADLQSHVQKVMPQQADAAIKAVKELYPNAKPFQQWSIIASSSVRGAAIDQAISKAAASGAPAYLYYFTWQPPILDGRPMAFHCAEMSFTFDNVQRCENMTGGGPEAQALADKVSGAWITFARTGNPNHPGLPKWPEFTAENKSTMVFDNTCVARNNLDDNLQKIVSEV